MWIHLWLLIKIADFYARFTYAIMLFLNIDGIMRFLRNHPKMIFLLVFYGSLVFTTLAKSKIRLGEHGCLGILQISVEFWNHDVLFLLNRFLF